MGVIAPKTNKYPIFRCVRKTAKSDYYLRHVCLSVRIEQLYFHWSDFHEM
jgi:hypothetical protein